jgi:hypothetical protein
MTNKPTHFSFDHHKDEHVTICHLGKAVTVLKGAKAVRFLERVTGADAEKQQLVMAKATGNFKRGNERSTKPGKPS